MNHAEPIVIVVQRPAERAAGELLNLALDFVLGHLQWWPYVLAVAVVGFVMWFARRS